MATKTNKPEKAKAGKAAAKRQRKPHRKSRLGCQNCKLRSIKCDEGKPACTRCVNSGFTCSYAASSSASPSSSLEPALELAHEGAFQVYLDQPTQSKSPPKLTIELPPPDLTNNIPIVTPLGTAGKDSYELTAYDLACMDDFYGTIIEKSASVTIKPKLSIFRTLAEEHPYLIHACLTLTHIYQRDICLANGLPLPSRCQAALAFHWYQASVLHNQSLLTTGHSPSEKDAIWAAASFLTQSAFGFLESHDPSKHWPNKPTESSDLYWMRLTVGTATVWGLTDPFREDSLFHDLIHDPGIWNPPLSSIPIPPGTFSPAFMSLFELDENSTADNSVFCGPASLIAQLLPERCDWEAIWRFTCFTKELNEPFCNLLVSKEPRALLILCWWWTKLCVHDAWWLSRRATVEARAICLHLENNYSSDPRIVELLQYPKEVLELLDQSVSLAASRSSYISNPALATFI